MKIKVSIEDKECILNFKDSIIVTEPIFENGDEPTRFEEIEVIQTFDDIYHEAINKGIKKLYGKKAVWVPNSDLDGEYGQVVWNIQKGGRTRGGGPTITGVEELSIELIDAAVDKFNKESK